MRLANRIAIVTGAGAGIGRATALRLADEGADIVLADIRDRAIALVAADVQARGRRGLAVQIDVTNSSSVHAMLEQTIATFGRVDILVNNAGGGPALSIEATSEEVWNNTLALNMTSTFLCSQGVVPIMKRQGYGRIVNLASTLGRTAEPGVHAIAYAAAKGGVIAFTRNLAAELAGSGITVNAIAPGLTLTEGVSRIFQSNREGYERQLAGIPMGRGGEPAEQAAVLAFLASEDASYVTGVVFDVNGGSFIG